MTCRSNDEAANARYDFGGTLFGHNSAAKHDTKIHLKTRLNTSLPQ